MKITNTILLHSVLLTTVIDVTDGKKYFKLLGLEGKKCGTSDEVFTDKAHSVIGCLKLCEDRNNCLSVFYEETTRSCQGCRTVFDSLSIDLEVGSNTVCWKKGCDAGWYLFDNSCYYFGTEELNITDSRDICYARGSSLVQVDTVSERQFLMDLLVTITPEPENGYWNDLYEVTVNGEERWYETNDAPRPDVLNWHTNQPDDKHGPQKCHMYYTDYLYGLVDLDCTKDAGRSICEKHIMM